ncbi:hypothetical protein EY643_10445 [Halioglobus maricola]|uniref:Uncharacterized protein n=1 Tax=Halioglobus maricola TaxID=2601894 RepID=A0A5P9NJU0_9GAMM|nr:hypothetical protein [Halioglobus maricola]QFU76047.1 hypothetical protein EY643_10445 [Halioglobus maricola]
MKKSNRKYYRTIFLGVAAMATLIWAAVDQFGIPWEEMLDLLLVSVLMIAAVIVSAAACFGVFLLLRRLLVNRRE